MEKRNKKKYNFMVISILILICYGIQVKRWEETSAFFIDENNGIEKTEEGAATSLELEIVTKQVERESGKEIEIQFCIENIGQIPVSNIILYSKSQNYATRIAILYPGEKQVFTKGESSKLLHQVTEQDDSKLEISLYTEGVMKKDGEAVHINNQKMKKIKIIG